MSSGGPYSINQPHPKHTPTVGRTHTGGRGRGGWSYGTTLRCSCGWTASSTSTTKLDNGVATRSVSADAKVSNESPSQGGRSAANIAYRHHLDLVRCWVERGWVATNPNGLVSALANDPPIEVKVKRFDDDEPMKLMSVVAPELLGNRNLYEITTLTDEGVLQVYAYERDSESAWWVSPESAAALYRRVIYETLASGSKPVSPDFVARVSCSLADCGWSWNGPSIEAEEKRHAHLWRHESIKVLTEALNDLPNPHPERPGIIRAIELLRHER